MKKTYLYNNGQCLSYADAGDPGGFPILIQHGMIASIEDSYLFNHLIQNGMRCISIARPGYGDSSPYQMKNIGEWGKIVTGLVDALGLAQFDVFGISSGAPYSYAIGYALPERVRTLYILSGIPALYDDTVAAAWPYPVSRNASLAEMQALAYDLFFAHLSKTDLEKNDVRDSLRNDCFGVGQDLRIRGMDWGFRLQEVGVKVIMRHSRTDNFKTAELTAKLLPNCRVDIRENDEHFSQAVLDDFIVTLMTGNGS